MGFELTNRGFIRISPQSIGSLLGVGFVFHVLARR